ncbi:hypothetical protein ABIB94_008785 [Bradyrhizobium sp. JR7.2]|uniref:hypothetical protein n=1 Tax=Bradyrhizobium TaxID=374 RepID=UPI0024AF0A12|nr:hypothetical protein [Bradyrhizobium barranii]WFT93453.1 hypothetical protein QA633_34915 [Bradyrhizobium barranii]
MIKIIAVLCNLSSPANCHEQTVTTSDFADVSMQSCLMGAPQLAEWMKLHPAERLAGWRCVIGKSFEVIGFPARFRLMRSTSAVS